MLDDASLRELLGNMSAAESDPDSRLYEGWAEWCRGLISGVIGVFTAQGYSFEDAVLELDGLMPYRVYGDCIPTAWWDEFDNITSIIRNSH